MLKVAVGWGRPEEDLELLRFTAVGLCFLSFPHEDHVTTSL